MWNADQHHSHSLNCSITHKLISLIRSHQSETRKSCSKIFLKQNSLLILVAHMNIVTQNGFLILLWVDRYFLYTCTCTVYNVSFICIYMYSTYTCTCTVYHIVGKFRGVPNFVNFMTNHSVTKFITKKYISDASWSCAYM